MTPHLSPGHPVKVDAMTRVMFAMTALAVAGLAALIVLVLNPAPQRVVLDNPVPQTVRNTLPNVPGPALTLESDVDVVASKCNLTDKPVTISGSVVWQSIDPRGTQLVVGEGVSVRPPGCTDFEFRNPVPPVVADRTRHLVKDGRDFVVWQIVGVETPQCDNCAPEDWWTAPFRLYVEAP
jgi:hypothetical protein